LWCYRPSSPSASSPPSCLWDGHRPPRRPFLQRDGHRLMERRNLARHDRRVRGARHDTTDPLDNLCHIIFRPRDIPLLIFDTCILKVIRKLEPSLVIFAHYQSSCLLACTFIDLVSKSQFGYKLQCYVCHLYQIRRSYLYVSFGLWDQSWLLFFCTFMFQLRVLDVLAFFSHVSILYSYSCIPASPSQSIVAITATVPVNSAHPF
jgi:hypothetical protein